MRPYQDHPRLVRGFVRRRLLPLHQLDVQAERLQLADQDVERFGHARLDARFALDDGLVNLGAAIDVVRLRGEQFLQDVRCAVGFQCPDFHFAEALASELRLAAERLLRDERVRPDGTRVNLVVDEMRKLEHVDVADGDRLVELVAAHAVEEVDLAGVRQTRDFEQVADFRFARAVENRRGEGNALAKTFGVLEQLIVAEFRECLPHRGFRKHFPEPAAQRLGLHFLAEKPLEAVAKFLGSPAEVRLEYLSNVHTRRNAERIDNDLHRSAVRHVRHVFLRHDAGDNALVAVAAGHLVADGKLALHGDVGLDQLDDARGQLIALLEFVLALLGDLAEHVDLARGHLLDFLDLLDEQRVLFIELQTLEVARGDFLDDLACEFDALGQQPLVGLLVVQVGLENFSAEKIREALEALIREDADFVGQVLLQLEDLRGFDGLVALVLFSALAGKDLDVHDGALDARRAVQRSVANIAGLFAEDGAEQFFFRRERGFALGRNLADKNVTRLHDGADADDSAFVEVAKERLADARVLVRTLELDELIDVRAHFAAEHAGVIGLHAHDNALGVDLIDDAFAFAEHHRAGITRGHAFHAGADERRFALDERHGLALHVGTHERAVGVVVFEERNQAGGHGNELLRRNVDVIDFIAALENEVAGLPAVDQLRGDLQSFIKRDVGLRDDVLVFFPSGKIEAIRLVNYLAALELFVEILDFVFLDDFTGFEFAVTGIDDLNVVDDAAGLDFAVGRFDEAVVVDARKAAQGTDQADVRAFRRFNRTDTAVVRRVHVAHFESGTLARQTARPKGREAPLMRDFAERVGLVHELAELRRTEELADRGHNRLGVYQVVRHGRRHFLVPAPLFLDGAFHSDQADPG